jgi:hypothetical protein
LTNKNKELRTNNWQLIFLVKAKPQIQSGVQVTPQAFSDSR